MSLFYIKLFALLAMVIDHLGVFIFPDNIYFRLIGRLSFPLFAWAIANGAYHTKSTKKYLLRIFILAVISQFPYQFLFKTYGSIDPGLNILFTLSLGLLGIILIKKTGNVFVQFLIASFLSLFAILLRCDYGAFGVLSIIIFYSFYRSRIKTGLLYVFLVIVFYVFPVFLNNIFGNVFAVSYLNVIGLFSILSLFLVFSYNGKIGYKLKYLFYVFYPAHLLLFYLLKLFVLR